MGKNGRKSWLHTCPDQRCRRHPCQIQLNLINRLSPKMTRFEDLPYRPCVGVMVLNGAGLVFIGRRSDGPEHIDETHVWQMPQGGIDRDEDPWPAALRE